METPKNVIHWIDRVLDQAQGLTTSVKQLHIDFNNKMAMMREDLARLREKVVALESQTSGTAPAPSPAAPLQRGMPDDVDPMSLPVSLDDMQDLRAFPRRRGAPILMLVAQPDPAAPVAEGWLLDRSQGGLGLIVDQSMDLGVLLRVRPANALPGFRWVRVQVRNCISLGKRWKLGCRFEERLTAKEMRQFE